VDKLNAWSPDVPSLLRIVTTLLFMEHDAIRLLHRSIASNPPATVARFRLAQLNHEGVCTLGGGKGAR